MESKLDLKEIESKVKRAGDNDGLLEIWIGFVLISLVLLFRFFDTFYFRNLLILPIPIIVGAIIKYLGKKYVTEPRLGIVKQRIKYKSFRSHFISFLCFAGVYVPLRLLFHNFFVSHREWSWHIYAAIIVVGSFVVAYRMRLKRYCFYGLIFAAPFLSLGITQQANILSINKFLPFFISSGIFIIIGLIMLKRFITKYPKQSPEVTDDRA
ncbi:MAG: hypothetical protein GY839_09245 [candidate division Zixibacteria bacterium]|nr:hypothetical protein [candidate division Zixibacteria bacterium]